MGRGSSLNRSSRITRFAVFALFAGLFSARRWIWAGLVFVVTSIGWQANAVACGALNPGESLAQGQEVSTCNGQGRVIHQADGNVVFYDQVGALWATGTNGSATRTLVMQDDGNLVLYSPGDTPLWQTQTHGHPGAWLAVQDDCNLVIYSATQSVLWASNKFCRTPPPAPSTTNGASFISQTVPSSLSPGRTATVSITMRNSGKSPWSPAALYSLGSQSPQDNWTWGLNRVSVDQTIPALEQKTFTFTITAPSTPGTYAFQWRMVQDNVEWFGDFTPALSIQVASTPPPAPCAGRGCALRRHPANPRYFQDTVTLEPVLIASYRNIVPTSTEVDYRSEIDSMQADGLRYARVWHLLPWAADPGTVFWPWAKEPFSAPACYDPSKDRWNLSASADGHILFPDDVNYWPRMTDAMSYASDRGITSEIMLFDKSGMLAPHWTNNPWAMDNNVNNFTSLPSCEPFNSGVPAFYQNVPNVRAAQEAYVRTMIDRTINNNVIYEIENEHNQSDGGVWAGYWGNFIKSYIAANHPTTPRLVSYSSLGSDLESALSDPNIDIVNLHLGQAEERDPAVLTNLNAYITTRWPANKAINVDEFGNGQANADRLRQMAWVIVTSGGHFHFEDVAETAIQAAVAVVQNINAFLRTGSDSPGQPWDFVGSRPATAAFSDEPFCMVPSNPGGAGDYLCYYTMGHPTGVTLNELPAGDYYVRWWNPRTTSEPPYAYRVTHGGGDLRTAPAPDLEDWVLFVRRLPDSPSDPPPPPPPPPPPAGHNMECFPSWRACVEVCRGVCERRINCGGANAHKCFE